MEVKKLWNKDQSFKTPPYIYKFIEKHFKIQNLNIEKESFDPCEYIEGWDPMKHFNALIDDWNLEAKLREYKRGIIQNTNIIYINPPFSKDINGNNGPFEFLETSILKSFEGKRIFFLIPKPLSYNKKYNLFDKYCESITELPSIHFANFDKEEKQFIFNKNPLSFVQLLLLEIYGNIYKEGPTNISYIDFEIDMKDVKIQDNQKIKNKIKKIRFFHR